MLKVLDETGACPIKPLGSIFPETSIPLLKLQLCALLFHNIDAYPSFPNFIPAPSTLPVAPPAAIVNNTSEISTLVE